MNWKAILFMALSALSFAFMDVLLKKVSHFSGFQLVFFRSLASLGIGSGYLLYYRIPFFGAHRKLMVLRGIVGCTSMLLFFSAVKYLPIGSAVSIRYLSPFFAAFFAIIILREVVHKLQWLFFTTAFLGVLILKGVDLRISSLGLYLMIGSAILSGLVYVLIRLIGTREHPVVIVNYFMAICFILGGVASLFSWTSPTGWEWMVLFSLGIFGFFGQLFMTLGLQIEEANRIVPFKYLEVIFVMLIAFVWLGESQNILTIGAITMIVVSLLLNSWYKRQASP